MSGFVNTIDLLGDEEIKKRLIDGSLIGLNDNNIKKISCSFSSNKLLAGVNFPNVKTIGDEAFSGCTELVNVDLPNATTTEGSDHFRGCSKLTNIDLQKITKIESYMFSNCSSLTHIDCPKATTVGQYAFNNCTSLISINIPILSSFSQYAFQNCSSLTYVDFNKASSFSQYLLSGCTALKNIILRNSSVCNLGNLNSLNSTPFAATGTGGTLLVPRSLVDKYKTATNWSVIWGYGYNNFLAIEDYTVDGTITGEIDWDKFYVTRGLANKRLSNVENSDVTSIRNYSFYNNNTLTDIAFPNVTSVGTNAFNSCGNLVSIDFPELETTTGQYTFQGCSKLASVNMPKLKKVDFHAFSGCKALKNIDLLNVTYIENAAFMNCSALELVRLPATPPTINSTSAFNGINSACVFSVPTGSLSAYQSETNWSALTSTYSFVEEDIA